MIRMAFEKLMTDPETQDQMVWLRSLDGNERFPLPIDGAEALAIYLSLTRTEAPLPLEYDATEEILDRLDARIEEVQILDLDEYGVYTEIVIDFQGGKLRMEVCPGDSIALALKYNAPIYLSEHLSPSQSHLLEHAAEAGGMASGWIGDGHELGEPKVFLDQEEMDALAHGQGVAAAGDITMSDAIDELLEMSGIDAATGLIVQDGEEAMARLSDRLLDAIRRERYEEAGRLMAEIQRMERGKAV